MMAAMAIDEYTAHAHLPHLAEGDLDGAAVNMRGRVVSDRARHAAIETRRWRESNCRLLVARAAREVLCVVGVVRAMIDAVPLEPNRPVRVKRNYTVIRGGKAE
ncbi:allophanate hydrolase subunit 2 [Bradyrhizobium diazoefficiens]